MAAAGPTARSSRSAASRLHPHRPRRVLDFTNAMREFQTMFPSLGADVIESVLRANNGSVDATIDQLISIGGGSETDGYSDGQIPMDGEGPPGYSPRERTGARSERLPSYHETVSQSQPTRERNDGRVRVKTSNLSRSSASGYTAPLVGPLPDDFLRIPLPKPQKYTQRRRTAGLPLGYAREQTLATTRAGVTVEPNTDLQVLEDERIALYIQNEEFLRELRRNREFIDSLESDRRRQVQDHMLLVYPSKNRHPTATVPPRMTRNYMPSHSPPNAVPMSTGRQYSVRATQLPRQDRYRDDVRAPRQQQTPPTSRVQQTRVQQTRVQQTDATTPVVGNGTDEQLTTLHGLGFEAESDDVPSSSQVSSDDDRAFKEKLRHMSKSTKKKLFQLARVFSRKKKKQNLSVTDATSRANLLDSEGGATAEFVGESIAEDEGEELDSPDELQFKESHLSFQSGRSSNEPVVFYSEDYNTELEQRETAANAQSEEV